MKITLSAAMRARDVSRPGPEQLTEAAEREEPTASPARSAPAPAEEAAQPRSRRRRRRGR